MGCYAPKGKFEDIVWVRVSRPNAESYTKLGVYGGRGLLLNDKRAIKAVRSLAI